MNLNINLIILMMNRENKNTISLIICSRNRSSMLKRLFNSMINSNIEKYFDEIVLVDNSSVDETYDSMKKFKNRMHKFINIVVLKENVVGLAKARQTAVKCSKGSWVLFTDDDVIISEKWAIKIKFLTNYVSNNIGGFGGPLNGQKYRLMREAEKNLGIHGQKKNFPIKSNVNFYNSFYAKKHLIGGNMCLRKTAILNAKGFGYIPSNVGGEDTWICEKINRLGYTLIFFDELYLEHWDKLTIYNYLRRAIHYGKGRAFFEKKLLDRGFNEKIKPKYFHEEGFFKFIKSSFKRLYFNCKLWNPYDFTVQILCESWRIFFRKGYRKGKIQFKNIDLN